MTTKRSDALESLIAEIAAEVRPGADVGDVVWGMYLAQDLADMNRDLFRRLLRDNRDNGYEEKASGRTRYDAAYRIVLQREKAESSNPPQ